MKFKHPDFSEYFLGSLILVLAAARFINIGAIPVFGDEALYLYLSDKILKNPATYLDSVAFGVFPVLIWIQTVVLLIFGKFFNPLFLGRVLSVSFDLGSAILVYFIGKELEGKKVGLFSIIIYLILPLTFFHSRFFLLDPPTNFFVLAVFYIVIRGINRGHLNKINFYWILICALILTASFFTKPLAIVYFPALLLIPFILLPGRKFKFNIKLFFINFIFMLGMTIIFISLLFVPVSKAFTEHYVTSSNTFHSILSHLKLNLWREFWWIKEYVTIPIEIIVVLTSISALFLKNWKIIWLVIWIFTVSLLDSYFSANFYPRHLFPLSAPISLTVGYFFYHFWKINKPLMIILLIYIAFIMLPILSQIIISPITAPIAPEDKQQFYEDWTSGVGNKQVAAFIKSAAIRNNIIVFMENTADQVWAFLNIYDIGQAKIIPSDNLIQGKFIDESEISAAEKKDIYIILNKNPGAPLSWPVKLIYSYPKGPNRTINIYKVVYIN